MQFARRPPGAAASWSRRNTGSDSLKRPCSHVSGITPRALSCHTKAQANFAVVRLSSQGASGAGVLEPTFTSRTLSGTGGRTPFKSKLPCDRRSTTCMRESHSRVRVSHTRHTNRRASGSGFGKQGRRGAPASSRPHHSSGRPARSAVALSHAAALSSVHQRATASSTTVYGQRMLQFQTTHL